jgi:hypothetical protein
MHIAHVGDLAIPEAEEIHYIRFDWFAGVFGRSRGNV